MHLSISTLPNYESTYGYSPANTFSNSSPSTNAPTTTMSGFWWAD